MTGERRQPISEKLREIAGDLAQIASNPPNAIDSLMLAKLSASLLSIAGQVALDERLAPAPTCAKCGAVVRVAAFEPNGWIRLEPHQCPASTVGENDV